MIFLTLASFFLQNVTLTRPLSHVNVSTMYLPRLFIIHQRSCVNVTSCGFGGTFFCFSPEFRRLSPVFRRLSPVFRSCSPLFRRISPVFRSHSPVFRRISPVFRKLRCFFPLYFNIVSPEYRRLQETFP